jgi:hypothetical protein
LPEVPCQSRLWQNRNTSTATINSNDDSTKTGFNYDHTIYEDFSNIPDLCTIKEFEVEDDPKAESQS